MAGVKLKAALDRVGWKSPWHEHFRVVKNGVDQPWNAELPPIYIQNCGPAECEAEDCPRTISGFPEPIEAL